jgi:fused signal recognition particle receptor
MALIRERWQQGLAKTRKGVFGRLSQMIKGKVKLDSTLQEEMESLLIEADIGVESALELIDFIQEAIGSEKRTGAFSWQDVLKKRIAEMVRFPQEVSNLSQYDKPHVILMVGVNGTGKTTTIGKLAHLYMKQEKRVLLAGADTFRAAATEQLEIWAERAKAELVKQQHGADPAAVAYDAMDAALARGMDVLIVDTAGRLHTQINLMDELRKIRRVIQKRMESAPHEVVLVIDATTGQNGLRQAKLFSDAVGVTGIALTKLDGTAKGGIVIAIRKEIGIPVKWVGVGEGIEDLVPFDAEAFAASLL